MVQYLHFRILEFPLNFGFFRIESPSQDTHRSARRCTGDFRFPSESRQPSTLGIVHFNKLIQLVQTILT